MAPASLRPPPRSASRKASNRRIPGPRSAIPAITFSSLLIGLLVGVQPVGVEISSAPDTAAVVWMLDGQEVARTVSPPWAARVNFGEELRPHELVASAVDAAGREVARVGRWVNTPQPPARLDILIETDGRGRPSSARLVATSVRKSRPVRQTLKLDGKPLVIDAQGRAVLPALDLETSHVLSGTADFSGDALARADVAFGGSVTDVAGSRMTAVPIRLTATDAPGLEALRRSLMTPAGSAAPIAIEKEDSTILLVRDPVNSEAERHLGGPNRDLPLAFEQPDRVGYVWPVAPAAAPGSGVRSELFEFMGPFGRYDRGFHWLLSHVARIGQPIPPPYRFADAVAVAGLDACGASTRRVVVLVEGEERRDASRLSPSQASGYLRVLGVPLRIWSLIGVGANAWSEEQEDISSFSKLSLAVSRLRADLETQRIVWIAGDWVPGQVTLSPNAKGLQLLR